MMRMRRSEWRPTNDADVERLSHARRERLPALFLREPDEVLQQQRLDAVPDETPDDVEEQDAAADAPDDVRSIS